MNLLASILLSLYVVASVFHSIGLYLLITVKRKRLTSTNDNDNNMVVYTNFVLLTLLSTWELLFSLCWSLNTLHDNKLVYRVFLEISGLAMGLSFSAVYIITLNRLLVAIYPFRYRSLMTKVKFVCMVFTVSALVTGIHSAGDEIYFDNNPSKSTIGIVLLGSVYLTYFIFCVSSYIAIFKKLFESRRNTQTDVENERLINSSFVFIWKELRNGGFIIPLSITFTYILFVLILAVIGGVHSVFGGSYDDTLWKISYCLW